MANATSDWEPVQQSESQTDWEPVSDHAANDWETVEQPRFDASKIIATPVYQPSQFSSGLPASVPIADNPDWEFTKATRGGLPGIMQDTIGAGMGALGSAVSSAVNTINKPLRAAGVPVPEIQSGKPIIPDEALPLAKEKGVIPALTRILQGFTTPENLALLPLAAENKLIQSAFLAQSGTALPDAANRILMAKTPEEQRDAGTEFMANLGMAALMAKGINGRAPTHPIEELNNQIKTGELPTEAPQVQSAGALPVEQSGKTIQPVFGEEDFNTANARPVKPPKVTIPEIPPEQAAEQNLIRQIRKAGATTVPEIQKMFDDEGITREEARRLRNLAYPSEDELGFTAWLKSKSGQGDYSKAIELQSKPKEADSAQTGNPINTPLIGEQKLSAPPADISAAELQAAMRGNQLKPSETTSDVKEKTQQGVNPAAGLDRTVLTLNQEVSPSTGLTSKEAAPIRSPSNLAAQSVSSAQRQRVAGSNENLNTKSTIPQALSKEQLAALSPEELTTGYEQHKQLAREAMDSGNLQDAVYLATQGQFYREALQNKGAKPLSEEPISQPEVEAAKNAPAESNQVLSEQSLPPTSIKNAIVDEERAKRGLPPVVEPARRAFGTVWDDATKTIEKDPNAQTQLIDELRQNPRAVTDKEDAMLLQRQITLQNEHAKTAKDLTDAVDRGDESAAQEHRIAEANLSDQLLDLYNINKRVGTETGRGLNARRMMANEDYTLAAMETRLRAAKDGKQLTPEEKSIVAETAAKVQKTLKAIEDYLAQSNKKPARQRTTTASSGKAGAVRTFISEQAAEARKRIAQKSGRLSAGIDPTLLVDHAIVGAEYLAKGVTKIGEWSKAMKDEFGEHIQPYLNQIYAMARKKAAELAKQANEPKALAAYKTKLENKTAEIQGKTELGDTTNPPRNKITLDAEAQRLKAAHEAAKLQFDKMVAKERLKNRTLLEKTQDTFVKWRRAFLLSSPVTLAKLTSAAIERMAFTPIEEAVGAAYSKLPVVSRVAKLAPREGGINAAAEARALTQGFTKGMLDSWNTLKTGRSELDTLYGKRDLIPHEMIDFIGAMHGALKAPVKRAEFERSLQKRFEFAIRKGQDPTDPMIQSSIALAAYKDANRAIFMQDNKVTAAWNAGLAILKSPDKATGKVPFGRRTIASTAQVLLPIVKVPTNIVAETMQYAIGSVMGSARLALALRRGVETLKPEEADLIMRELKKGTLGTALLLLGYFNPTIIGGYYQANDRKQTNHPKFGTLKIGDLNIPTFLIHNPLLETLQIGATIRHVADSKLKVHDDEQQGKMAGIIAAAMGLTEEVPFVKEPMELVRMFNPYERNEFARQFAKDMIVPLGVSWVAQHFDRDANGNYIARKPETLVDAIKSAIPLLRQQVPIDEKKTKLINKP